MSNFGERSIPEVSIDQLALTVHPARIGPFYLRIYVTIHNKKVEPSVVVVIEELRPPTDVRDTRFCGFRRPRNIREGSIRVLVINGVVIIGKVSHHDVESTVAVIIPDRYSHASLLDSVFVDSEPQRKSHFGKRAIMVVAIGVIRGG